VAQLRWTIEQTMRALFLYFQMPFGRLHQHAPEIISLANEMGRTPSSIAMKLGNFASLDPEITGSGRKGLQGASALDRQVFGRFYGDWDGLVAMVNQTRDSDLPVDLLLGRMAVAETRAEFRPFEGASASERTALVRRGQSFFRNAVLANYEERCCITGIADPRLLTASHIRPWQTDIENRHNPANGFALSATFDRAFDRGLLTIDEGLTVQISRQLLESPSERTRSYFAPYHGKTIRKPTRFLPDQSLLAWHNANFHAAQN
jgi:putative restriction endonuclease